MKVEKVTFTVEKAVKAQRGSRGIALLFPKPRRYRRGVGNQSHAPAALPPEKEARYSLYRRLDAPQKPAWTCGEEFSSTGI